jgi:hypothetical protein
MFVISFFWVLVMDAPRGRRGFSDSAVQALRDSNLQPTLANFPWTEPSSRIHHLFNSATSSVFRVLGGVFKLHLRIVSLVASV